MTVAPGSTSDQTLTGTDPNGLPLTFTKAAGPTFMTVTTTSHTTGNVHLAPPIGTSGTFVGTVTASNGTTSDSKSFVITVCLGCGNAPVLAPISNMTVDEGGTANQAISGTDPDGNPLAFSKSSGPVFMTVTTLSPGTGSATGNIRLAPGFADAGTYSAAVLVTDGSLSDSKSFTITVNPGPNQCPTSNPDGPYSGLIGTPVVFDGTGSSDPDGDPLTYLWDFGDGNTGSGHVQSHTYPVAGAYTVMLTVRSEEHTSELQSRLH